MGDKLTASGSGVWRDVRCADGRLVGMVGRVAQQVWWAHPMGLVDGKMVETRERSKHRTLTAAVAAIAEAQR